MEFHEILLNRPSWLAGSSSNGEQIVLNGTLSIARNIEKYPFPQNASVLEKQMVFNDIVNALKETGAFCDDTLQLNLEEVSEIGKTLLFERDFTTIPMSKSNGDRGVVIQPDKTVIRINSENHLTLRQSITERSLSDTWRSLDQLDTSLGSELTYAFDSRRGFLLSSTAESGTGLSLEYTLHLPALVLTETVDQVLAGATQLGLSAEGKFRDQSEAWGAIFIFKGSSFTGTTEEEIIENTTSIIDEICAKELEARERLFSEAALEMEDKIWRSYGILRHARLLSIPQLINLSSTLRLGIERGILDEILSMDNLNAIIAASLQGSIALLLDDEKDNLERYDQLRAETVRTLLE